MSQPILFALPGNEAMAKGLGRELDVPTGVVGIHHFPDGETLVQVKSECRGRTAIVLCTLDRPDDKLLSLYFLAATLRDLGATQVLLVSPYLAYMRQDHRFHDGEGVTAKYFASLLSAVIDGLITVDPHLHRIQGLEEVYSVPSKVVHAAPAVATWVHDNLSLPVLIGPDSESHQWVSDVAGRAGVPFTVLEKVRRGDRDVEVTVPDVERWRAHTPVLVDDIISTARTMIETIGHLKRLGFDRVVCIGVHGIFAQQAYKELSSSGATRIATCNSVRHESNDIDLTPLLAAAVREWLCDSARST